MAEILCFHRDGVLYPAAPVDRDELSRYPRGYVTVTIERKVMPGLPRLYHALCAKLAEATGHWPDGRGVHEDLMRRAKKLRAHYLDTDGNVVKTTVASTAKWDIAAWRAYLDFIWPIILAEIIPGVPVGPLRLEVERMAGITYKEARGE